jgi:hypothetical protein
LKVETVQTSFVGGEFATDLLGRTDIAQYSNACETLENILIRPYGSALSCPGTEFISDSKYEIVPGGLDADTVLLLHLNEDGFLTDSAGKNTVSTFSTGLVRVDSSVGVFSESGRFEPTSSATSYNYLVITPSNSNIYISSYAGSFTFDFRMRFSSFPSAGTNKLYYILRKHGSISSGIPNDVHFFYFYKEAVDEYYFVLRTGSSAGNLTDISFESFPLALNTWYHIAFVKSGSTLTLFQDGILNSSLTIPVNVSPMGLDTDFWIGRGVNDTEADEFNGWMDEIRWTNKAVWTSNFTPPSYEYAVTPSGSTEGLRVYGKSKVNPFIFSRTDSYIIETGETYFRFYTNGAQVQA